MFGRPSYSSPGRYSAKKMAKPVNFIFQAPQAKHVSVVGDFNHWHANAHPMKRQPDGAWMVQIPLHHGHHQYQFLVDGRVALDPRAQGTAVHPSQGKVSLLAIS